MAKYVLMSRAHEAAVLEMADSSLKPEHGFLRRLEVLTPEYLPFPVKYAGEQMRLDAMESWILRRIMSQHRFNIQKILNLSGRNTMELSMGSYGLTVTDGYWFRPEQKPNLRWEDINFFDHDFSYDIGNLMFGILNPEPCLFGPDLTTNGQMEKTWRRRNDSLWLLKKGSPPFYEEPFNEKAISRLLARIAKVPYVTYDVAFVCRYAVSVCENFTKDGVEFVSAADLAKTAEKPSFLSIDEHIRDRCRYFKIPDYSVFMDQIRVIDYIIANFDRHLGNFGFLYDTEQEKFLGPAPIFDNGSSLWCQDENLKRESPKKLKEKSISLARNVHHPERILLPDIDVDELRGLLSDVYTEAAITSERAASVGNLLAARYESMQEELERAARQREKHVSRDVQCYEQEFIE